MSSSTADELRKIKSLFDDGILTRNEYTQLKETILENSYCFADGTRFSYDREKYQDLLQSSWASIVPELQYNANRLREDHKYYYEKHLYYYNRRVTEVADAYAVAKAVVTGLSPDYLTDEAIDRTISTTQEIASQAANAIGQPESKRNSAINDIIRTNGFELMSDLRIEDLPPQEISLLRTHGVDIELPELDMLFKSVRVRGRRGYNGNANTTEAYPENVFERAEQILSNVKKRKSKIENDELKESPKPPRKFFKGIRNVLIGSVLVIVDVGGALGWPPFNVEGWGSSALSSIIGGVGVALDGVGEIWHDSKQ